MTRLPTPFATEAEMCAAFIEGLPTTYTAYAETAGFDILLVRNADRFQIGVEAKLSLNAEVLTQALEGRHHDQGPDCRAVLVPERASGFDTIAAHLALTVIRMRRRETWSSYLGARYTPPLPQEGEKGEYWREGWHELCPTKRCDVPGYVPDVVAGASGPTRLTAWKIAAIKIAIVVDRRGYVTRDDFRALKIDHRRWIDGGWLVKGTEGWVRGAGMPAFTRQHPRNYAEIEADFDTWSKPLPKLLPFAAQQPGLL